MSRQSGPGRALAARFAGQTLPLFLRAGWDWQRGGHVEGLDADGLPLPAPYRRVMVHARQLHVFSTWAHRTGSQALAEHADRVFDYMVRHFHDRNRGGWFARVDQAGAVIDSDKRLYDHAFVLFGFSGYLAALGRSDARRWIDETADVLEDRFSRPDGSFAERMSQRFDDRNPGLREQNPHMHLLEAALALLEADGDTRWRTLASRLLELFHRGFLDRSGHVVREYLDAGFTPVAGKGRRVEAGHHFEWAWLLDRSAALLGDERSSRAAVPVLERGLELGWDRTAGGVFDETDAGTGRVLVATRRLWPVCELIKALVVNPAPARGPDLGQAVRLVAERYVAADGRWTERFGPDWTPVDRTMPASSLYHLAMAIAELEDRSG